MNKLNSSARPDILQECQNEPQDIVIVGGGISGAGAALEATRRGFKVCLLEQNDFGSGTSSASSKLIHGGLRYLEIGDLHQVFESCKDRKKLLRLTPQLVHPLEFLFPVYKGQRRWLITIYIGTWIYYFLALFRNIGIPRRCNAKETQELAPKIKTKGLSGAARYFDAATIDSRLTLSTVKTANSLGAKVCNHAKVIRYIKDGSRICGVVVQDLISGLEYEIRSRWVVNTIGPWTDGTRKALLQKTNSTVRLTKGVHIIVEGNPLEITTAMVMLAPQDGRVTFLIPWLGHTMIGTTDDDYKGSPEELRVTPEDVDYLKDITKYYFPDVEIDSSNILSSFAGLRCLKQVNKAKPSDVTREEVLFSEMNGLLTMAGGKLTSFLSMSEKIINWLCQREEAWSHRQAQSLQHLQETVLTALPNSIDEGLFNRLIDEEMATTVTDLLKTRTLLYFFERDHARSRIDLAASCLKKRLQYSDAQIETQIQEFENQIEQQSSIKA